MSSFVKVKLIRSLPSTGTFTHDNHHQQGDWYHHWWRPAHIGCCVWVHSVYDHQELWRLPWASCKLLPFDPGYQRALFQCILCYPRAIFQARPRFRGVGVQTCWKKHFRDWVEYFAGLVAQCVRGWITVQRVLPEVFPHTLAGYILRVDGFIP